MHLSDCFIDIFAYGTFFLKTVENKNPSIEQVKTDIGRLLTESEGGWSEAGLRGRTTSRHASRYAHGLTKPCSIHLGKSEASG